MWLIAGLGNPGLDYENTRHNIGFMAIDRLVTDLKLQNPKKEKKAELYKYKWRDEDIIFVKPMTYMNLSGEAIVPLMNYYKIPKEHLLVIHDDIDQEFTNMKLQKARGHGGQNGVRNLHQILGTNDYSRLKLGVSRPSHPSMDVSAWVLSKFKKEEVKDLEDFLQRSTDAVKSFIFDGFEKASDQYNRKFKKG